MAKVIAKDIDKLREADEIYWNQQLSRLTWRVKGDRNTGFFHAVSAEKGKFNLITALQDHLGVWHRDPTQIQHIASNILEETVVQRLQQDFTREEVKLCLFSMIGDKAPGPDRMLALFFQHY
ncbi:hypothetical protein LIER_00539 [Lithospermum erythrorhizon]|uniref:Uncharacterized protein n=1 Tax=Lithospermum erythrorhizon TaxID=34254 RepID=A0AAV3NJ86_LITER